MYDERKETSLMMVHDEATFDRKVISGKANMYL